MTARLCCYRTLLGLPCRHRAGWRVSLQTWRCKQHAVIEARLRGVARITRLRDGLVVEVATVPRRPRKFVAPTTAEQALRVLPTVRSWSEQHQVFMFLMAHRPPLVKLGGELWNALLAARGRLMSEAPPEDTARHLGVPVEAVTG